MTHEKCTVQTTQPSDAAKERKIFFVRHGYHIGDHVTEEGKAKLAQLRSWLEERHFRAVEGVSSPLSRSIETATYLMYGNDPKILSELNAINEGWGFVYVKSNTDDPCRVLRKPFVTTEFVTSMIPNILIEFEDVSKESEANDLVVVCHKLIPLQLAWHYVELQGQFLSWNAQDIPFSKSRRRNSCPRKTLRVLQAQCCAANSATPRKNVTAT
jgi:hypothetical protein